MIENYIKKSIQLEQMNCCVISFGGCGTHYLANQLEDNGLKVMETIKGKLTLIDKLDIVNEKTNQTYYFIEEDAQAIESQIEKIKHFVKLLKEN